MALTTNAKYMCILQTENFFFLMLDGRTHVTLRICNHKQRPFLNVIVFKRNSTYMYMYMYDGGYSSPVVPESYVSLGILTMSSPLMLP